MKQSRKAKTEMQRAKDLKSKQREELLRALKARFEKNMNRHKGLEWAKVQAKLEANTEKLWSLNEMERTGGEPDVVGHDKKTGEYIFYDCSAESPKGRRSVCYDREALESRKEHKPKDSAMDMAAAMGIELLTEEQYRELQKLGNFDTKTSSWVKTPSDIRKLGGALFCDRRYDTCLRVSQRCGLLLCRQGVPWLAKGLNFAQTAKFELENGSRKREECKRQRLVRKRRHRAPPALPEILSNCYPCLPTNLLPICGDYTLRQSNNRLQQTVRYAVPAAEPGR